MQIQTNSARRSWGGMPFQTGASPVYKQQFREDLPVKFQLSQDEYFGEFREMNSIPQTDLFIFQVALLLLGALVGNAAPRAVGPPPVRPPVKREVEPSGPPPVRPPLKREAEPSGPPPVRPPVKREAEPSVGSPVRAQL